MIKRITFLFIAFVFIFSGCRPYLEEQLSDINIDLKDPTYQRIYEFQDQQMLDSLYPFFRDHDPTYRYVAALAIASIKDSAAIDSLKLLLEDGVDEVRAAAAYSIGQTGMSFAAPLLIQSFESYDTAGVYAKANRAILEAIGKCGNEDQLRLLSTISTYETKDTFLLEGQARGIYQFALRGLTLPRGTDQMIALAGNQQTPNSVRLIAANYLSRATNITIDSSAAQPLIQIIKEGTAPPPVRMALAIALGKVKSQSALVALLELYDQEEDYRIRANILRAFGNFEYADVQNKAIQALKDPNLHVAIRAAQYFVEHGTSEDATFYWRTAKDSLPSNVQLQMYKATSRYLPYYYTEYRNAINAELRQRFRQSASPYAKADVLSAMGEFGWNFRFIKTEGFKPEQHPAVRTASIQALDHIGRMSNYRSFFGGGYPQVNRELARYFKEAIEIGDTGMSAEAASALINNDRRYARYFSDLTFIDSALNKLELPKDIETYNTLLRAQAFLNGQPAPSPITPDYNHPINWDILTSLTIEPQAILRTSKGNIQIKLLPKVAPGSVANFIQLARDNYFDNKNFHRVVPNFVVQGGCSRGDGYGAPGYSIRSELPNLHYDKAGYVGMASAGNHTESAQFFITHSPALHLDGKYTIFGRVTGGDLKVVHEIQIGDLIEDVVIQ